MVESAPQDRIRLFRNKANASEPATKAKKPICGENPPSRAVAICSGMATATRVRPATRSRVRNEARYEAKDRKIGQRLFVPARRESAERGSSAINSLPHRKLLRMGPRPSQFLLRVGPTQA